MTKKTSKKVAGINNKSARKLPHGIEVPAPVAICNPDPMNDGTPEPLNLPPAIVAFLVDSFGGLDSVRKAWAASRARALSSLSFQEIHSVADSEGWTDILATLTPADLSGPAPAPRRTSGNGTGKPRGRAAVQAATVTREKVTTFLRTCLDPVPARLISDATGLDRDSISSALGFLTKSGAVKREGNRHSSVYSIA